MIANGGFMKRIISTFLLSVMLIMLITGCAGAKEGRRLSDTEKELCGSWAYIHDTETAVLVFKEDGSAKYKKKNYDFSCEDGRIVLSSDGEEKYRLRYLLADDAMYFFEQEIYERTDEAPAAGDTYTQPGRELIGMWRNTENKWSFQFTEEGTFNEDGYFPGHFWVDEEAGTFKLAYNDHFEDTTCYYTVDGDRLTIEYPWPMVRMIAR